MYSVTNNRVLRTIGPAGLAALTLALFTLIVAGPSQADDQCVVNAAPDAHAAAASCCPKGKKQVGTVTSSTGRGAPAAGTPICSGTRYRSGALGGFDVNASDGSGTWHFLPLSTGTFDKHGNLKGFKGDVGFTPASAGSPPARGATDAAASGPVSVSTVRGTVGVYGSASHVEFTLSAPGHGAAIFHVVAGRGFARQAGSPMLNVPAGYGAKLGGGRPTLTTEWPKSGRAAIPAGQRPPAISGLGWSGGAHPHARFRLDRTATVVVRVLRHGHVAASGRLAGHPGAQSVALRQLGPGGYVLVVIARDSGGLTGLAQRGFTVR